jgi:pimeloyl-ACP methyl ester carboxylesterase
MATVGSWKATRSRAGLPRALARWLAVIIILAGCTTGPAPAPSPAGAYTGLVHSDDDIKRFIEYHGPTPSPALLAAWKRDFLSERVHRAFAVSSAGGYGAAWHASNANAASDAAMRNCQARGRREHLGTDCRLYAVDTKIVYPEREFELPKLSIAVGDFIFRNQHVFYGPHRAKGVIVVSHGYGGRCVPQDGPAWPFINRFNLAGWDILYFDRDPCYDNDTHYVLSRLRRSVPKLREAGYSNIVLAGQSLGGFISVYGLRLDETKDLVTGIISVSGGWGTGQGDRAVLKIFDDWHQILGGMDPSRARVLLLFFDGDTYDRMDDRVAIDSREILTRKQIPNLVVYENDPEVLNQATDRDGHFGAYTRKFTLEYSDCMIRFIETGEKIGICAKY